MARRREALVSGIYQNGETYVLMIVSISLWHPSSQQIRNIFNIVSSYNSWAHGIFHLFNVPRSQTEFVNRAERTMEKLMGIFFVMENHLYLRADWNLRNEASKQGCPEWKEKTMFWKLTVPCPSLWFVGWTEFIRPGQQCSSKNMISGMSRSKPSRMISQNIRHAPMIIMQLKNYFKSSRQIIGKN